MDFNLTPFEGSCFISDMEWNMIIESGSFIKLKKTYYAVYRNHVLSFLIRENGLVELLQKRKKPNANYVLPAMTIDMTIAKKCSVLKEESRLMRGVQLDSENYLKYAM